MFQNLSSLKESYVYKEAFQANNFKTIQLIELKKNQLLKHPSFCTFHSMKATRLKFTVFVWFQMTVNQNLSKRGIGEYWILNYIKDTFLKLIIHLLCIKSIIFQDAIVSMISDNSMWRLFFKLLFFKALILRTANWLWKKVRILQNSIFLSVLIKQCFKQQTNISWHYHKPRL